MTGLQTMTPSHSLSLLMVALAPLSMAMQPVGLAATQIAASRVKPVTVEDLRVAVSPGDLEDGCMPGDKLRQAADILAEHGVVCLQGAMPTKLCDAVADAVKHSFTACVDRLADRGLSLREPFAFEEICHRAPGRYDVQLGEKALLPLSEEHSSALAEGIWHTLLTRLLGRDMCHNFNGAVVAEPGAAPQRPHMDGGHLFHATHGFSLHLPVHIVNVFLPLIDMPLEVGPTEFWPGSHVSFNAPEVAEMDSLPLVCQRGDVIIFDYRVYHRGLPNLSEQRRPMLYQTYSRSWFRDSHNFPTDISLAASPGKVADSLGLPEHDPSRGFTRN